MKGGQARPVAVGFSECSRRPVSACQTDFAPRAIGAAINCRIAFDRSTRAFAYTASISSIDIIRVPKGVVLLISSLQVFGRLFDCAVLNAIS